MPTKPFHVFLRSRWGGGLLVLLLLMPLEAAVAQDDAPPHRSGSAVLTGWPDTLEAAARAFEAGDYQLLPELDALTLEYRYAAAPSGAQMSFVLAWAPGDEGLYEGRIQPYEKLPPDIRMVSVELLADVIVGGRDVAKMIVAVDTMALASHPSVYTFEVSDLAYDAVFLDTPADSARRYLETGFTLRNPRMNRIAFASMGEEPSTRDPEVARDEPPPPPRPRPPRSVYEPRVGILIGWRLGPEPYYVGRPRPRRTEQPRGGSVGRTTEEGDRRAAPERGERRAGETEADRSSDEGEEMRGDASTRSGQTGRGETGNDEDDRDDEDEDSLLPASVVAVAAVGAVAVLGGTVGYHGTGRTPIGLTAGWVRPGGGGLLQASVSSAVLGGAGRQHLESKVLGFYDAFGAPVQPAVGLGAVATAEGDDTTLEPSLAFGAVGNVGRVLLMAGYDVLRQTLEFGIAVNFRWRGGKGE